METTSVTQAFHTDSADRYNAQCHCGGTILRLTLNSDEMSGFVRCYSCGFNGRRLFDWSRWGYADRAIILSKMTLFEAFTYLK